MFRAAAPLLWIVCVPYSKIVRIKPKSFSQMPSSSSIRDTNKLVGLEVIRFISALAVLFWHYQHFWFVGDHPVDFVRESQPLYSHFSVFYDYGFYGVQVFWCLSGFIFFWKYRQSIDAGSIGASRFFLLRFSRLYPLHVITLLLVAALQIGYYNQQGYYFVYQANDLKHFLLQFLLASHWGFQAGYSFNGPIWSISVEVAAYVVFFLLLRHVGRSVLVNLAVLVAYAVAKWAHVPSQIVDCIAFFYAGGLSAIAFGNWRNSEHQAKLNSLLLAFLVLTPLAVYGRVPNTEPVVHLFLLLWLPPMLLLCARKLSVPARLQSMMEAAGNMTYSSYLIHFPIQLALAWYFAAVGKPIPYHSTKLFLLFMGLTMLSAYFIYRLFELPVQNLIRGQFDGASAERTVLGAAAARQ
ncbi:acyltransferase family protein [Pseudoduganella sp. UC29_106]|uniref:acyltransferase family protein n=1 Tax=Pseudoduganella sp. UC29_106 TaxID=3374553 RepID=UPI0037578048